MTPESDFLDVLAVVASLVISFWFAKGDNCVAQQDVVQAVSRRYLGRVNFLSLDIRDELEVVHANVRTVQREVAQSQIDVGLDPPHVVRAHDECARVPSQYRLSATLDNISAI